MEDTAYRAIAIVGAGAVLPDAPNVASFWQNIKSGRYSISDVTPDRWDPASYYDSDHSAPDKTYSKIGGWVREFPWDPIKWRLPIPPRVAKAMDESQQWGLACTREALEDYGFPGRSLDPDRTAVIIGSAIGGEKHYLTAFRVYFPEYARELDACTAFTALPENIQSDITREFYHRVGERLPGITEDSMPGELANCLAGRIANIYNFHGPNYTTDAACASTMAALNAAMHGLVEHDFDYAVAGGIDRNMGPSSFVKFCKIGALSATGSRPYAEGADGFVMGEGAALFLLRRLADAERDGDKIYAVLRGVGGSSDGKGKGITAPNPVGQKFAIQRAWQDAGLSPATATLFEGHGTSTMVGDVVEVQSMVESLASFNLPPASVALGSVKSNIGHLKGAAGAAGMLKTILALRDKVLPPSLNCGRTSPDIDFAHSPLYVNSELKPWTVPQDGVRRAGLSAFGFGGTNFHLVLEEYIPGRLKANGKHSVAVGYPSGMTGSAGAFQAGSGAAPVAGGSHAPASLPLSLKAPLRGALVIGADTPEGLAERLRAVLQAASSGHAPAPSAPAEADLRSSERLAIDFADAADLADKSAKALKALSANQPPIWKALRAQGIFRGQGPAAKVAFLFTGQGSQYVNMVQELRRVEPIIAQTFEEADRVLTPLLGKPLSEYIFIDGANADAVAQAEDDLRQTAITQPAVIATDVAMTRLLAAYGVKPDMAMGHSVGEYGALVVADALPFEDAMEAVSARGREMTQLSLGDNGKMAAVFAPLDKIEQTLKTIDGYVVIANVNSKSQAVIGGDGNAVDLATEAFLKAGYNAMPLSVSHAFHTSIVAPASEPLKRMLQRLRLQPPRLPIIANIDGDFYPTQADSTPQMVEMLAKQVASPVQFVKGLQRLYEAGARVFVETGPKKALQGFADDVLGEHGDVISLFTNHPKLGDLMAFNQALCGLYAAGLGSGQAEASQQITAETPKQAPVADANIAKAVPLGANPALAERFFAGGAKHVVITGAALGLPGTEHIFDDDNIARILNGEQFIDVIPLRFRRAILDKHITRLVKSEGGGAFETIGEIKDVIKLAGRGGAFDIESEFGMTADRAVALDRATALAIGAGIDALRDAGIPLVMRYKTTSRGTQLPERWQLPESLRDETGVIFASAFPGHDSMADMFSRFYEDRIRREQLSMLKSLQARSAEVNGHSDLAREIDRHIEALQIAADKNPYMFDRRYILKVLSMGHSQFAEFIGARGPNMQINAACASTPTAVSLAEDWIRAGRCRRVVVISADDITSDHMLEWMGAGFLASGAAATGDVVEDVAVPFDRRRNGLIIGMGAASLVVESADAVRERGIQPICEVLGTTAANSAFHGTRLDAQHIVQVMEDLVATSEARNGISRFQIAPKMVFVSHETYTPARGGSASAEINALRKVFREGADQIVIANTKGFTGHAMGTGIEDVVAVKALETGCVPPVPNFKEVDPELGTLNLSKGGSYPVEYALRLAAGFGSEISMMLLRWVATKDGVHPNQGALGYAYRIADREAWKGWLGRISGNPAATLEVVRRTLRVCDAQASLRATEAAHEAKAAAASAIPVTALPSKAPAMAQAAAASAGPVKAQPSKAAEEVKPVFVPQVEPAKVSDPVKQRILALVSEKTGYPVDMLDLDLDLEADLGVDTVKQAEVFAGIREAYGIARDDQIKLRDYPTLSHVLRFVYARRPELATQAAIPSVAKVEAVSIKPPVAVTAPAINDAVDEVKERILALVVEKTGYPRDMLDLDLDLEADLGVDTVKQAEMFAAIRETYNIPRDENIKLRDYPTLARVIGFVRERRPDLALPVAAPQIHASPSIHAAESTTVAVPTVAAPAVSAQVDPIQEMVLEIVAEKTGYPKEMLDLDLDLEADLGVDTVKQAEMFAAVRAAYNIPRDESIKLRDFPTLAHVIKFAHDRQTVLAAAPSAVSESKAPAAADESVSQPAPKQAESPRPVLLSFDAADSIPRRVPIPLIRPALDICKPTGVALGPGSRVVLMPDKGGVADALSQRLQTMGVEVLRIEGAPDPDALVNCLKNWAAVGPVQGVYWLAALDREADLLTMDLADWRTALQLRVKSLFQTMRTLYDQIAAPGTFLVSATLLGGQHGYDDAGAVAPLGGAVVGMTKTYKRERGSVLVKAVDFEPGRDASSVAEVLLEETLRDPGAVEVGYKEGDRWSVVLAERPVADGQPGLALDSNSVFVVTGAAGSIVSAITADLAVASGGTFYLLDLVPEPDPNNSDLTRFVSDKEGLKRDLFGRIQARGERATPALVEKELAALERAHAALSAIQAVQAAGGTPHYFSVNLTNADAVAGVIEQVRQRSGHIDVLLHAAGMERSHFLPDKDPREFDLIFDVKSDGWFNLLRAIGDMPLGATVAFSSIAGRFGNGGQADYSSANDLLCKITSSFRTTRPATRGIVIDWTAWAGIGMATRGSIPKMMEVAGIDMLPPEAGVPWIRRELTAGATRGEVLVGKRLGILEHEFDATGGLDVDAVAASAEKLSRPVGPMIGKVVSMGLHSGLVIETTLDPARQAFLHDHQIGGTAVLPGVMGIEAFAEAALVVLPGWRVEAVEDVQFSAPFKFYRKQPRAVTIHAVISQQDGAVVADCRLTGQRSLPKKAEPEITTHFTARVRLTKRAPVELPAIQLPAVAEPTVQAADIYRVYFHGPAYQVLDHAWRNGNCMVGQMKKELPNNHQPSERPLLLAPRFIELCFQTAGLWEMGAEGRMGLPQFVRRVCVLRSPELADSPLYAVVTPEGQGSFDAEVVDASGNRYLQLSGYTTVALPERINAEFLTALWVPERDLAVAD